MRQIAELEERIRLAEAKDQPIRVWHVKCGFMSTSVILKIKASDQDEAIGKARKQRSGKGAESFTIVGVEDVRPSVSGPTWKRMMR